MRRERRVEGRELACFVKCQKIRNPLRCRALVQPRHTLCDLGLQIRHGEHQVVKSQRGRAGKSVTREHDIGNCSDGTSDVFARVLSTERCQEAPRHRRPAKREKSEKREHMPSLHAAFSLIAPEGAPAPYCHTPAARVLHPPARRTPQPSPPPPTVEREGSASRLRATSPALSRETLAETARAK